jgi:glycerol-3-phosphate dehydrogenase
MWDDVLAIETLRSAYRAGAAVANYVEAVHPTWEEDRITGFHIRDLEETGGSGSSSSQNMIHLRAHRTIICAGPWTDQIGEKVSSDWQRWLNPSKGIHLIFDLKRIPVPGAMVMTNPDDGRVSFVMPRPDYGAGVVIVGTTDGPTDDDPEKAEIRSEDVQYLMNLLQRYFPDLKLTASDILSGYVGVRPLMGGQTFVAQNEKGQEAVKQAAHKNSSVLQKVSREHHIARGPGGTVIVAGGKYTTHRKMAEEIVDYTLKQWKKDDREKHGKLEYPKEITRPNTRVPVNPMATEEAVERCREGRTEENTYSSRNTQPIWS